jgi:large subunit ribosomal protein L29
MPPADRELKLYDLRAELARIKTMINAGGAVENPTRVRELRKVIAQILTVQNEEKIGLNKTKEPEKKSKIKAKKTSKKIEPEEKTSE